MKFLGVVGLLLATACGESGDETTQPDGGALEQGGCKVAGCSDELCIEEEDEVFTTCQWKREYACYETATCARQSDGQCNWTSTPQLRACLLAAQAQ